MLEIEIPGGRRQAVQMVDGPVGRLLHRAVLTAQRQAGYGCQCIRFGVSFQRLQKRQKTIFAFAHHRIVDVGKVGEQVMPQEGGADAPHNGVDAGIEFSGHPRNIDGAPAVGMHDGKSDDLGIAGHQGLFDGSGIVTLVIPVENLHLVAVGPEHGAHIVKPHGNGGDLLHMQAWVEKIGIDQQDSHVLVDSQTAGRFFVMQGSLWMFNPIS